MQTVKTVNETIIVDIHQFMLPPSYGEIVQCRYKQYRVIDIEYPQVFLTKLASAEYFPKHLIDNWLL